MRRDDLPHDGKPEAGAVATRLGASIETLENFLPIDFSNARSGVLHLKQDRFALATDPGGDRAAPGRIAQGIVDQVDDQFAQQGGMAPDHELPLAGLEAEVDITR